MNIEQNLRKAVVMRQLRALDVELAASLHRMQPEPDALVQLLTALVSYQYGRGHSCFDLTLWCENPYETLGYTEHPAWLAGVIQGLTVADVVVRLTASGWCSNNGSTPLTLLGDKLYLTRLYNAEQTISTAIAARIGRQNVNVANIQAALNKLFPEPHETEVNWQKLACAMAALRHFAIITGGPGTGKTTTVVRLLGLLQHLAEGQLNIVLAAPTGKAAARLQESIGKAVKELDEEFQLNIPTAVSTLHRLLGSRPGKRSFRHDSSNPLTADVVIVDEASMVDAEMMAALLSAVKPSARLVLLGDKDQLASVEAGSVLADLCEGANEGGYNATTLAYLSQFTTVNMNKFAATDANAATDYNQATVMLRRSYRFGADSGIGELSRAVNAGQTDLKPVFAAFNDIHWLETDPASPAVRSLVVNGYRALFELIQRGPEKGNSDEWAKQVLKQQRAFQVLCAMRKGEAGVNTMNERITQWLRAAGLISIERQWYAGRAVMIEQNNYTLNLMNGDVGMALWHPETEQLRVVFEAADGSLRWVLPARLSQTSTVYAMTIHKSQGSEFAHTVMVLPNNMQPLLTRELLYTAITRASEQFTMVAEQASVVAQACEQRVQRSSGL